MAGRLQAIADKVKEALDAATFSPVVTVERVYDPQVERLDLPASTTPLLSVVAKSETNVRDSRGTLIDSYVVDVAIRCRVADETPASCDPLSALVDSVADYFWETTWTGSNVTQTEGEISSPWSVNNLAEQNVFLAVVSYTFTGLRDTPTRPT